MAKTKAEKTKPDRGGVGRSKTPATESRFWWGAAAVALLISILTFDFKLCINGDNVSYMELAAVILEGNLWPSSKYPPLFPMMLAPIRAVFGTQLLPYKLLVFFFLVVGVLFFVPVFRRRLASPWGPLVLLAAFISVPVLEYSHYVMSEIPFLGCLGGALYCADRWLDSEENVSWKSMLRNRFLLGLAAFLIAGFYIRSAGAATGAGIGIAFLLRGRWRSGLVLAGLFLLGAVPWMIQSLKSPGGGYFAQISLFNPYYPEFGKMDAGRWGQRIAFNLRSYFLDIIPVTLLNVPYRSTYSEPLAQKATQTLLLSIPVMSVFFLGFVRGLWRRDVASWAVFTSLGLLLLWPPVWSANRFLIPLIPLFFLLLARGAADAANLLARWSPMSQRVQRAAGAGLLGLLLVVGIHGAVRYEAETDRYPENWGNYFDALEWLRDNAPEDVTIIERKPGFVRWVTGREGLMFPRESDPEKMRAFFEEREADYIVLAPIPYDDVHRYLTPAVSSLQSYLTIEYVAGDPQDPQAPFAYVFKFHPQGKPAG